MRLIFVTPRFRAADPAAPELLAAELAARAPGSWKTTVLTTTEGDPEVGGSGKPFRDGEHQEDGVRVARFPVEAVPEESEGAGTDPSGFSAGLAFLRERLPEYDLVVLFGSSAICREAAKVAPGQTVLLPFVEEGPDPADASDIYEHPGAFIFGSESEEVQVLERHQVHRRMRETIAANLLLPRTADPAAFRGRSGVEGPYLIAPGPLEPGRGVEELVRFFRTFRERRPATALELVLIGPATIPVPPHRDIKVVVPAAGRERLDAVGGALMAVISERLAAFSTTAAEPFSLGTPILVNASATEVTDECRASGGGLWYQNYDEFELILELGLTDPALFARMGAAGRAFLESRHDWRRLVERYDRAFRSFARPLRAAASASRTGLSGAPIPPGTTGTSPPAGEGMGAGASADSEGAPAPVRSESEEPARAGALPTPAPEVSPEREGPLAVDVAAEEADASSGSASEPEAAEDAPAAAADPQPEAEDPHPKAEDTAITDESETAAATVDAVEDDDAGTEHGGLPSFFRGSIRD